MTEGKPVNTTTQYPIDIYGEKFHYKVETDGIVIVYHNNWENIYGVGKTIQEAIKNMLESAVKDISKYKDICKWGSKIKV